MKRLLCCMMLLLFLTATVLPVSAQNTDIDWDTVDWNTVDRETFDFRDLKDVTAENAIYTWLTTEADFHAIFTFWRCYRAASTEWGMEGRSLSPFPTPVIL